MKKNILNIFNITSDQYDAIEKTGLKFQYNKLEPTKNKSTVSTDQYDICKIVTLEGHDVTLYILSLINNLKSNEIKIFEILEEYRFEQIDKFTINNITTRLIDFMYSTHQYDNMQLLIGTHIRVNINSTNTLNVSLLLDNKQYKFDIT